MFDLSEQTQIPNYELKLRDGTHKSYDTVLLSYKLRSLDGEEDPAKLQEVVNTAFEIEVDALTAMLIIQNFTTFSDEHLEEPLKKVLGAEPSSTTSTVSRPESVANSPPQNTSD